MTGDLPGRDIESRVAGGPELRRLLARRLQCDECSLQGGERYWSAPLKRDQCESQRSGYFGLEKEHEMARKDYTPEQAIGMLREAEVRLSQGPPDSSSSRV